MANKKPYQLQSTKHFIRNFLRINNSREFLVFIFFLFVAFVFWYLMTMSNEYEMTYSPALKLQNVPDKMIVTDPLPENIDITLRDRGDKLVEYKARGRFNELTIDYNQFVNNKGRTAIYGSELNKLISSKLSSSTQIVSISIDTLEYYVASAYGKKVPVKVAGRIEANSQHGIQRISIIPDSVTVYATSSYLDSLKAVYTTKVHYVGLTDSISETLKLATEVRGIKFEPTEILLKAAVSPYVTKTIEVPINGYLFPYGTSLKTFPSKAKVMFRISLEDYNKVTEEDLPIQIHYSQVKDNHSGKVEVHLATKPEYIHNIKIEPKEVDYLLEINALSNT